MNPGKYILLLCLLFLTTPKRSFCQSRQNADTSDILQLIERSAQISDSTPETALQLLNEALEKSTGSKFDKGIALTYAKMGRLYFGNNIDSTVQYAQKALALFEKAVSLPADKADMHLLLAEAYDEQGHTDSSAYYYYLLGDEAESGRISDPGILINIYTKLAIFWVNVYSGVNTDEKITATVRSYVDKVKYYARLIKDPEDGISRSYFVQGIYYHFSNFDSARYYYQEYLVSREKLKSLPFARKISTLANIADTYLMENRASDAMPYINQVKEMCKDPGQANHTGFYMAFIGIMEGKALYQQKQYKTAIDVFNNAIGKLKTTGGHLRSDVVEAYKLLATSYEATGNAQQALVNKNIFIDLNDSLSRKEKIDMISRLEIRYRIAQKDKELVEQQLTIANAKDKIRNKNVVIGSIAALVLILGLLLIMWRRRNIHKQKLQQRSIETLQQKIKIERLNATIAGEEKERTRIARELHDGVGGLLTAAKMNFELVKNDTSMENNPDFSQGLKLLEEAGDELRQAARNLMPEILLQEGLLKAVRAFCERVSEKSDTRISFQPFGDKKIADPNFELSVYRIIQELVHNIVKHSRAKNAIVQISLQDDGGINITVEDDGVGINKTTVTHASGGGMGLKNIEDRIKETGGKLDIKSNKGEGTSVYIEYDPQI